MVLYILEMGEEACYNDGFSFFLAQRFGRNLWQKSGRDYYLLPSYKGCKINLSASRDFRTNCNFNASINCNVSSQFSAIKFIFNKYFSIIKSSVSSNFSFKSLLAFLQAKFQIYIQKKKEELDLLRLFHNTSSFRSN